MAKEKEKLTLPQTKAENAEERLEELIGHKSVTGCKLVFNGYSWYHLDVRDGEYRSFPDGFEAVESCSGDGVLYLSRRTTFVYYDLKKDYEKQALQAKED